MHLPDFYFFKTPSIHKPQALLWPQSFEEILEPIQSFTKLHENRFGNQIIYLWYCFCCTCVLCSQHTIYFAKITKKSLSRCFQPLPAIFAGVCFQASVFCCLAYLLIYCLFMSLKHIFAAGNSIFEEFTST